MSSNDNADLRFFVAITDAGSLAEAARRMDVTASSVSQRLRQLESRLGLHLVHRSTRRFSLTDEGEVFYAGAVKLLAELDELMRRHQLVSPRKIQEAARFLPATYIVFDLLYAGGQPLLGRPLAERRGKLEDLVARQNDPRLVFSAGVVGGGKAYFRNAVEQGHEGVMAKHLSSRYLPGQRGQAWRKIKPFQSIPCVVLGYTSSRQGVRSLLVGAVWRHRLQYVAELTSGFTQDAKTQLAQRLGPLGRSQPAVPCAKRASWVEPQIYCEVRFLEWTARGRLRGAHYRGLVDQ